MNRNRSLKEKQILLLSLAVCVFIILTGAYFFLDGMQYQSLKNFLQGVSGNIIATVLSFIIIYLFFTGNRISLNDDETSFRTLSRANEILNRINEALSNIDVIKDAVAFHNRVGKVDDEKNQNWLWVAHNEGPNKEKLDKIGKVDRNLDECLRKVTALLEGNLEAEERYELTKENTSLKIELESLKGRLQNFQTELQSKEGEIARKNRELDEKNHELSLRQRRLDEKDEDLRRKDREIREMNDTLSSLKKEMSNLTSTFNSFTNDYSNNKGNTDHRIDLFGSSTSYQLAKITKLLESPGEK